ncbi:MAG: 30S ribosomal protein S19 [Candidatus Thermoplasmatota archaeon]|jgi:small subunit ribosomal protein S19|nr:30S ribosomal protein S19 [Candidatus Thermoplasmatota archaeon]
MVVKRQASVKSIKRRSRKSQKITMGRSKEFLYRGLSLEELKKMSDQELFKILPSRARRSLTREMNPEQKKLYLKMNSEEKEIKTHVRDFIILPKYIGKVMEVYNGNSYVKFEIKPEMMGHYLGEYAQTRKEVKHSGPGVGATRSSKFMPLK